MRAGREEKQMRDVKEQIRDSGCEELEELEEQIQRVR